jgi:cytochrome c-type biogenesis protein CcmE
MALGTASKIGLGLVLAGALTTIVLTDSGEGVLEYVYVNDVVGKPGQYAGRTIKVHGIVVEGSIQKNRGSDGDYKFVIEYGGERMPVHFTNIPPDTFQEGGEVILTGRIGSDGQTFESEEMSAKCPSKYEEERALNPVVRKG